MDPELTLAIQQPDNVCLQFENNQSSEEKYAAKDIFLGQKGCTYTA